MFFFRVTEYLRYLILSGYRKGHGIHSPFLYDVVSRVFRNKTDQDIVNSIERARDRLIADPGTISICDLGSGPVRGVKNEGRRKVSEIAKYSSVPRKYGILLSNMAKEFGKPYIIELGTSFGISTLYMASASPDLPVHTIEGCPETAKVASENFVNEGVKNIELHFGSFDDKLPEVFDSAKSPGLIFIDGNHNKEPLLKYFRFIADNSGSQTVVIVDDIYLSPGMKEAWQKIRNHEKVSATIDIYRMGIVFFRKGIISTYKRQR